LIDEACSVAVLPPPTATAASILDEDWERLSELVCNVPIVPVIADIAPSTLVDEVTRFAWAVLTAANPLSILVEERLSWREEVWFVEIIVAVVASAPSTLEDDWDRLFEDV
jgi:hypothetical protein